MRAYSLLRVLLCLLRQILLLLLLLIIIIINQITATHNTVQYDIYIYICICICMYIYIYIYTHIMCIWTNLSRGPDLHAVVGAEAELGADHQRLNFRIVCNIISKASNIVCNISFIIYNIVCNIIVKLNFIISQELIIRAWISKRNLIILYAIQYVCVYIYICIQRERERYCIHMYI